MDLKGQAIKGSIWAAVERSSTQVLTVVTTIILARLLTPSDFGTVGMLGIFIAFAQLIVDSGIGDAIIRKTDRGQLDFSTMFWFNLGVACLSYAVLFAGAPLVAWFYGMPVLTRLLRLTGLILVTNALMSVQVTRLTSLVDFKTQAKVTVSCCVLSSAVGIVLAFRGWGVWALAWQTLTWSTSSAAAYWLLSGWHPSWMFSFARLRSFWNFGSKLMAANFLGMLYDNLAGLIVGKRFGAADLGFYARGNSIANLPGNVFQSVVGRISYPVLSSVQDDPVRMRRVFRKYAGFAALVIVPGIAILCLVATPLVRLVLGEQWLPCVPYLRVLALASVFGPFTRLALRTINVKGRSDLSLKLVTVQQVFALVVLCATVPFGILWMCVGTLVVAAFTCALDMICVRRVMI